MTFLDFEKAYVRVYRKNLLKVLKMHDVNGKFFNAVLSFCCDSKMSSVCARAYVCV